MDRVIIEKLIGLLQDGHIFRNGPFWCYHVYASAGKNHFEVERFCEQPPTETFRFTTEEFIKYVEDSTPNGSSEENELKGFVNAHERKNGDDTFIAGCDGSACGNRKEKLEEWSKKILPE